MTKTVSLETAKLLKEAGWKKWRAGELGYCQHGGRKLHGPETAFCSAEHFAAPDTTELLEALPNIRNKTNTCNLKLYRCDDNFWECYFNDWTDGDGAMVGNYLARHEVLQEALALLWLELRKQKLV